MDDDSVSDQNSALVIDKVEGVMIIDLESRTPTRLNNTPIKALDPNSLKKGDSLIFAKMPGCYRVTRIDYSKMKRAFEKQAEELAAELKHLENID